MRLRSSVISIGSGWLPLACGLCCTALPGAAVDSAAITNLVASPVVSPLPAMPGVGSSIVRLLGAFALILALLMAAVWFLRHGGQFARRRAGQRHLHILEMRALGNRQSLVVVGYQSRRLLLATAPSGVRLLTELPPADPSTGDPPAPGVVTTFADALQGALGQQG